jgi:hypothetical protein
MIFQNGAFAAQASRVLSCEMKRLYLPEAKVKIGFYESSQPKTKSIIILPPTGGENLIDRSYASALCEAGFDVYVMQHWDYDDSDSLNLQVHERIYEHTQKAIGLVVAQIESPFIGILGTSVGAIHSSVATSLQPRINAAFLIVGGAPIANVIVHSDQDVLVRGRKKRYEMFKFKNDDEYAAALDREIKLDPFKLAPGFKGKTLGMIISSGDTTVPSEYQEKLRDLWQPQTLIQLSNGHFVSILKSWLFHKMDVVRFFRDASHPPAQ